MVTGLKTVEIMKNVVFVGVYMRGSPVILELPSAQTVIWRMQQMIKSSYAADDKICLYFNFNREVDEVIASPNTPRAAAVYNVQTRFKNRPEFYNLGGLSANLNPYFDKRSAIIENLNEPKSSSVVPIQRNIVLGNPVLRTQSTHTLDTNPGTQLEANGSEMLLSRNHTNRISSPPGRVYNR